ncbi:hypothetical protein [Streptomyces sp. NPDC049040]|uniref:hypothetical protein n=1 Tax=Streptomyces sp. NPDC049040 TaxID=3365593 RepID=UPI003720391E
MPDVIESGGNRRSGRRRRLWAVSALVVLCSLAVLLAVLNHSHGDHEAAPAKPATPSTPLDVTLGEGSSFQTAVDPETNNVSYSFKLLNASDGPVRISQLGDSRDGMKLVGVTPHLPVSVPPGSLSMTITFHITDCARISRDQWDIPVHVTSHGGSGTVSLALRSDGPTDPWQLFVTRPVCNR